MEKFKSHLLTALGVAVVMLTIMLFTSRQAVTQTSTSTANRRAWQNNFVFPPTTLPTFEATKVSQEYTVPAGRVLQIDSAGIAIQYVFAGGTFKPTTISPVSAVYVETTVGGVTSLTAFSPGTPDALQPFKVYADPGTIVRVSTFFWNSTGTNYLESNFPAITLHGQLIKPAYL